MRVLVDGHFDPLHIGHLEYFRQAKALGGKDATLLCRVANDETKRPSFQSVEDRILVIQSLECVDSAFTAPSLTHAVVFYDADLLVKGVDWKGRLPDYLLTTCKRYNCKVDYTDTMHRSSTAIVSHANAIDLDHMERLYREQPTPEPTVTDDSHVEREKVEGKNPDLILEHLSKGPILDYGCGVDKHLVKLLLARGADVVGFDPAIPNEHEDKQLLGQARTRDLVICRGVLEHVPVRDYLKTIESICNESRRLIYITTRLAANPTSVFRVDDRDDYDPTHCTMPTKDFLRSLLVLHGFRCRPDLEEKMDWQERGRVLVYER